MLLGQTSKVKKLLPDTIHLAGLPVGSGATETRIMESSTARISPYPPYFFRDGVAAIDLLHRAVKHAPTYDYQKLEQDRAPAARSPRV